MRVMLGVLLVAMLAAGACTGGATATPDPTQSPDDAQGDRQETTTGDSKAVLPILRGDGTYDDGQAATNLVRVCGSEERGPAGAIDVEVRRCVWGAYQAGEPVEFTTTRLTEEGDPVTETFTLAGPDRVYVYMDSQDRFGLQGTFRYTCSRVEPDDRSIFTITECTEPVGEGKAEPIGAGSSGSVPEDGVPPEGSARTPRDPDMPREYEPAKPIQEPRDAVIQ